MEFNFNCIITDESKGDTKWELQMIGHRSLHLFILHKLELLRIECNNGKHYNKYTKKRKEVRKEFKNLQMKLKVILGIGIDIDDVRYVDLPMTTYDVIIGNYDYGLIDRL